MHRGRVEIARNAGSMHIDTDKENVRCVVAYLPARGLMDRTKRMVGEQKREEGS